MHTMIIANYTRCINCVDFCGAYIIINNMSIVLKPAILIVVVASDSKSLHVATVLFIAFVNTVETVDSN